MQNTLHGQYQITEADKVLFSDLLNLWEEITKILITDQSKACKAYIQELSQLSVGDKVIDSFGQMNLELLYNLTKNYGVSIICIYKKQPVESLKLERFSTLINRIQEEERSSTYTEYYSQKTNQALGAGKNI